MRRVGQQEQEGRATGTRPLTISRKGFFLMEIYPGGARKWDQCYFQPEKV